MEEQKTISFFKRSQCKRNNFTNIIRLNDEKILISRKGENIFKKSTKEDIKKLTIFVFNCSFQLSRIFMLEIVFAITQHNEHCVTVVCAYCLPL